MRHRGGRRRPEHWINEIQRMFRSNGRGLFLSPRALHFPFIEPSRCGKSKIVLLEKCLLILALLQVK